MVHRAQSLLPAAQHHLSIIESDEVPAWFLSSTAQVDESTSLAAAILGQRQQPVLHWKFAPIPLGRASQEWEDWAKSLLIESFKNAPISAQPYVVTWVASAFSLAADITDVWTVPPSLRGFDESLKRALEAKMAESLDGDFIRRLAALTWTCLHGGKTIPSRKLLQMISVRSIRDPKESDYIQERTFEGVTMTGSSVEEGLAFFDRLLTALSQIREGLISPDKIERRVMSAMAAIRDPRVKEEVGIYSNLFPTDRYRNWQYFPSILKRLARSSITAAITTADAAGVTSTPPVFVQPKPKGGMPALPFQVMPDGTVQGGLGPGGAPSKKQLAAAKGTPAQPPPPDTTAQQGQPATDHTTSKKSGGMRKRKLCPLPLRVESL